MAGTLADIISYDGDKSDLYREIGRFVFEYSQLESELRRIFRRKIGIDMVHRDIMTAAFDFAKLVTAILAASAIEEDGRPDPALEKLLKACHEINDKRVAVVHGRWSSTFGGDQAYQVARGSMKQKKYFEFEGDIDAASDVIVKVREDINLVVQAGDARRDIKRASERDEQL